jgi:DNA damage-binding protein 1
MATSPYLYLATSQKPTGVTHAITGAFTGGRDLNLILGKTSRLEIHTITPEGLVPVTDVGLYGRIANMQLIRLPVRARGAGVAAGRGDGRAARL